VTRGGEKKKVSARLLLVCSFEEFLQVLYTAAKTSLAKDKFQNRKTAHQSTSKLP